MRRLVRRCAFGCAFVGAVARAQQPAPIPIRALAPVTAKTSITFVQVDAAWQLTNGKVLVNDARGRRMFVFDSTLQRYTVLVDSATGTANSYPRISPALIFYLADTTLFLDVGSQTLTLIEPGGTLGRTVAVPNQQTVSSLLGSNTRPGVDQNGRLVFRGSVTTRMTMPGGLEPPGVSTPDTAPIVRADFNTRAVDTIAWMKIAAGSPPVFSTDPRTGKTTIRFIRNPVGGPVDDFAVLANGAVAIVRGQDYHIDWNFPDGTRRSTPKMPYDWRRLTDEEKQAKIDSARRIMDSVDTGRPRPPIILPSATGKLDTINPTNDFVAVGDVPDFVPSLRRGAVKPDADGNLWILPTTSLHAKGGLLYDVVNQNGEIFERVQLPADCEIVGFGRGGMVYLTLRSGPNAYYIEKTRVQR